MKIIISPAKTMSQDDSGFSVGHQPLFLNEASQLLNVLKKYSVDELMTLMKCNRKIAELNWERFSTMNLTRAQVPALFSYVGLQYQKLAPQVLSDEEYQYVCEHLRILSGFYGLLRPDDGIVPYRLEMQTPLKVEGNENLYEFWGQRLYKACYTDNDVVLNLASKEYSDAIEPYLKEENQWIECVFGCVVDGKIKVKGTLAKMARGAMVRWMAEHQVENLEDIQAFSELGFLYQPQYSTNKKWVFLQTQS